MPWPSAGNNSPSRYGLFYERRRKVRIPAAIRTRTVSRPAPALGPPQQSAPEPRFREGTTEELNFMTNRILAMVKPLALSIFAIAFLALSAGEARADEVFIAGFTNGCFGVGCTPGASA